MLVKPHKIEKANKSGLTKADFSVNIIPYPWGVLKGRKYERKV